MSTTITPLPSDPDEPIFGAPLSDWDETAAEATREFEGGAAA